MILVVDDNEVNLKLLRLLLESEGHAVRTASSAVEALALLEQEARPQVILMDIQLPGMDGLELTRRLKADPRYGDIPVIAVTANAMKGDADRALAAGCDDYLTKPIDLEILLATIEARLAGAPRSRSQGPSE